MAGKDERLVSVIVAVFNGAPYLAEAIDSVFAQSYRPVELIVVDDGSTDGSGDIARGYGDSLLYEYRENAGHGAARNRAVQLASGQLFAFLDADDRFLPDKLDRQWRILDAQPEIDMVFGHVREFVSPELTAAERESIRAPASKPAPWTAPNPMLIRRESYLRVGPFAETLKVGVTVDWYARALEAGLRAIMLPEVVLERRLHLENNGIREQQSRSQYLHVLKASLERRRALAEEKTPDRE